MSSSATRVAIVQAGHWHADYIVQALRGLSEVTVVGVSDGDLNVARRVAESFGAREYADDGTLLDRERPDFVFAFGQPFEMAEIVGRLVERRIPFSLEKPAARRLMRSTRCIGQRPRPTYWRAFPSSFG